MIASVETARQAAAPEGSHTPPEEAAPFSLESARYEVKTVCERLGLDQVLAELRLRGLSFRPLHPRRTVQSIYLDTPSGRAMEENLAGVSRREKIRFRWYGGDAREVSGSLERKIRDNRLGWKQTFSVPGRVRVEGSSRSGLLRALAAAATPAWRERLGGLEPAQWIVYEREYLATLDGAVRLTIDRDLRFFDQRRAAVLSRGCPHPVPQMIVIECKAPASREAELHDLLGGFPLVVDKCSKFIMASGGGRPIVSLLTL